MRLLKWGELFVYNLRSLFEWFFNNLISYKREFLFCYIAFNVNLIILCNQRMKFSKTITTVKKPCQRCMDRATLDLEKSCESDKIIDTEIE